MSGIRLVRAATLGAAASGVILMIATLAAGATSPTATLTAGARRINLAGVDLPPGTKWNSAPAATSNAEEMALGRQAITCLRTSSPGAGRVSPDAFGTVGTPSGTALVDVTSPTFTYAGSTTGLPSVNSEVVVVSNSTQATNDLAAFGSRATTACWTKMFEALTQSLGGVSSKVTSSLLSLPRHGDGSGGVHLRIQFTPPGQKTLYTDAYFYVEGRAEISIAFASLGSAFPSDWASTIASRVMSRASATSL